MLDTNKLISSSKYKSTVNNINLVKEVYSLYKENIVASVKDLSPIPCVMPASKKIESAKKRK